MSYLTAWIASRLLIAFVIAAPVILAYVLYLQELHKED